MVEPCTRQTETGTGVRDTAFGRHLGAWKMGRCSMHGGCSAATVSSAGQRVGARNPHVWQGVIIAPSTGSSGMVIQERSQGWLPFQMVILLRSHRHI